MVLRVENEMKHVADFSVDLVGSEDQACISTDGNVPDRRGDRKWKSDGDEGGEK